MLRTIAIALTATLLHTGIYAQDSQVTPDIAQRLCKVVDPQFLNALPALMELKNKGYSARSLRLVYRDASSTYEGPMRSNMSEALSLIADSNATTREQALAHVEQACMKRIM